MRLAGPHIYALATALLLSPIAACQPASKVPDSSAPKFVRAELETCASDPGKRLHLVSGKDVPDRKPLPKPAKGEGYRDPLYGTCVRRVTDHVHEPPKGFARNDYSRREPFNADGSLLLVAARDGYWHLYDAKSLEHVRRMHLGGGSVEPQWHPTNPDILFTIPNNGGMELLEYNVRTGDWSTLVDFNDEMPIAGRPEANSLHDIWPELARLSTRSEGSPSMDARYWAFQAETQHHNPLGLVSFDLKERKVVGIYDFEEDGNGIGRPDHVSMSPKGNYVVASWNGKHVNCPNRFALGTHDDPCGLMVFSRDFSRAEGIAQRGPHSDIALDADGNEVIVISNYVTGDVEMIDLASGEKTALWSIYDSGDGTAMHFSGKAYERPGWILISTYATRQRGDTTPWFADKIMAVELKENPRIVNIASTYNRGDNYFSEPHAAVNHDFTRIVYNSNWGTGRLEDIDVYLVDLPANALPSPECSNCDAVADSRSPSE